MRSTRSSCRWTSGRSPRAWRTPTFPVGAGWARWGGGAWGRAELQPHISRLPSSPSIPAEAVVPGAGGAADPPRVLRAVHHPLREPRGSHRCRPLSAQDQQNGAVLPHPLPTGEKDGVPPLPQPPLMVFRVLARGFGLPPWFLAPVSSEELTPPVLLFPRCSCSRPTWPSPRWTSITWPW